MARTTEVPVSPYSSLFAPFNLKHLPLKNWIISTSHAPSYAENGRPGERYQRYHEEKARGGLAMTMFGGASSVSPDSPPSFGQIQVGDDGIIPYFKAFAKRIHAQDVALMCQLSHAGRRTHAASGNWLPAVAVSPQSRTAGHRLVLRDLSDHNVHSNQTLNGRQIVDIDRHSSDKNTVETAVENRVQLIHVQSPVHSRRTALKDLNWNAAGVAMARISGALDDASSGVGEHFLDEAEVRRRGNSLSERQSQTLSMGAELPSIPWV